MSVCASTHDAVHLPQVKAREEKAVSEKVQLEQKLKLQRVELMRRTNAVQAAEDSARAEIHSVTTATASAQAAISEDASSTRATEVESFHGDFENLKKEVRSRSEGVEGASRRLPRRAFLTARDARRPAGMTRAHSSRRRLTA